MTVPLSPLRTGYQRSHASENAKASDTTAPLTNSRWLVRESFNLESALESLPPEGPEQSSFSIRGQAGVRLRACYVADISDALLRDFARETLGATRCSEQYLDALRIVLGNQAQSEKYGYTLEMNQRVSFAPPRVMRTIIDQMQAAGISFGSVVGLGMGRSQAVQCYPGRTGRHLSPAADLEFRNRRQEAWDDDGREAAAAQGESPTRSENEASAFHRIPAHEVPY